MSGKRIAVVAGKRTPQAKAFGKLAGLSAVDLGVHASKAALNAAGIDAAEVDEVVFGNVAGQPDASNLSRVISLQSGMREDSIAHTVNRNCGSGLEAIISGCQALVERRANVVLAGGTESMSSVPLLVRDSLKAKLLDAARAKSAWGKIRALAGIRPRDLKPVVGLELGLTDPVCGLNMGETAEVLAKEFAIPREHQDAFAVSSHQRAVSASERCFLSGEIAPLHVDGEEIRLDVGPRKNQSLEQLAKLRPIFDSEGSVTPGNSCPLTDGAAALVLKREDEVDGQGVLGFVSHYAIAGCDPKRMGLGPVFAIKRLFEQTGMQLSDFGLIEINEAFATQVIACCQAIESKSFAQQAFGVSNSLGAIDPTRLNVHGGAIALGHPVGATGSRLVLTLLRALRERNEHRGLATLCVGGGQGMAMIVETE